MGMVVRTNTMANNAFRQLGMNNNQVSKSLEKLASGYRINRAGDDAAGLAVSESMKAQITGLEAASSNSQDAISLVQTAEGALTEVHDMLNRMVELSTKAANGTYTDAQRQNYQDEIKELKDEIDRISKTTEFNGQKLLDGSMGSTSSGKPTAVTDISGSFSGANVTGTAVTAAQTVVSTSGSPITIGSTSGTMGTITVSFTDDDGNSHTVTVEYQVGSDTTGTNGNIVSALNKNEEFAKAFKVEGTAASGFTFTAKVSGASSNITSIKVSNQDLQNDQTVKFTTTTEGKDQTTQYDFSAIGNAKDGDKVTIDGKEYTFKKGSDGSDGETFGDLASLIIAADSNGVTLKGNGTTFTATKNGNDGLSFQVGATADADNVLTLNVADMSATALGVADVDVSKVSSAQAAIDKINSAIDKVSKTRSGLGAMQNRLEHTINNLDTTAENLSAANSRIRDTDMAKEMMQYTQMNVLVQSAQAMLAQANQQPQSVLQLLQ